jgi:hypothetical protein
LGLTALAGLGVLAVGRRLCWTRVHTALALFVAVQLLTTAVNARTWPDGPKFVMIYLMGFACFALAAEGARGVDGQRWFTNVWIGVGVVLAVFGVLAAGLSNVYQRPFWGSGASQVLSQFTEHERILFGARATFNESNLFSSFLLIPLSLSLWAWRRGAWRHRWLVAALVALLFGLVNGITRAAWLSMLAILAVWWWARRPRSGQVVAVVMVLVAACLLQALCLGAIPVRARLFESPSNLLHRVLISRVTIDSWLERPVSVPEARYFAPGHAVTEPPGFLGTTRNVLLGHGAGSVNRLSLVLPIAGRVNRIWNANIVLFVLHDSGVLGLATLLGVLVVIARRSRRVLSGGADPDTVAVIVPLLASGTALCFAYQFTHGLWLMYPYVGLGLLTAVVEASADGRGGALPA